MPPHPCLAILPPGEAVMVLASRDLLGWGEHPQRRPALRDGKGPSLGYLPRNAAPVNLQKLNAFAQGPQLLG